MKVLIACEFSGIVREAFRKKGHDAWSCDILDTEIPSPFHIKDDVLNHLNDGWDLMIAHPPCTYLAVSGARWFSQRLVQQVQALDFVKILMTVKIQRIAVENPVSVISTKIRKPDQTIQPYMFGHPETKKTCLWLKGLPELKPTKNVYAEMLKLPDNLAHKVHYASPGEDRGRERSRTYPGIAEAMADQWGNRI